MSLQIPYLSQWDGDPGQGCNCGPACVAMACQALGLRPAGLTDAQWVQRARDAAGGGTGELSVLQLATAAAALGAHHGGALVGGPGVAQCAITNAAIFQEVGGVAIMLLNATVLGRGYDGHYVVLTAPAVDAPVVVNDPDSAARGGKVPGGANVTWPMGLLTAAVEAGPDGPDGLVVGL
jgi:hypothetical protein